MKRATLYFLLVCAMGAFATAPTLRGWGCKGHQTVALLAEKHLTPEAKQMVQTLLSGNPIDPSLKRFCGNVGLDAMADSATWADDERSVDPSTGPWHFIDVPLGATQQNQVEQFCGAAGCVTQAITQQLAILKDKTATPANRATALRFILHFVGDLHQPLHATDNDDRGANCVPLTYFRRKPHDKNNSYTPNLHHIWDTEIVERQMEGADPEEFATTLDTMFTASFAAWQQGGMQLDAWAWEGHQRAVDTAYGKLPVKIAPEPANVMVKTCADDNNIGQRMLQKNIVADATYQAVAGQVAEERLAQAGIRLAMILNDAAKTNP
jgi:hypothetical protein